MPFIAAPIAAAIGIESAIGIAAVEFALNVGAAVGLAAVANMLSPAPKSNTDGDGSSRGNTLSIKYGGSLPRQANLGRGATAGHLVYVNVCDQADITGRPNETLQCVYV